MKAYQEPPGQRIEIVLGSPGSESATLELETPFGQFAANEILPGTSLGRQCLVAVDAIRHSVGRWRVPPGVSPRVHVIHRHIAANARPWAARNSRSGQCD